MRAHGELGFITLDAFSSDAIPIHLLTQEALRLYVSKLRPHGVLAFHISNKYLDLERVVGTVAAAGGLACYAQIDAVPDRFSVGKFPSHWVAMARSRADLGRSAGTGAGTGAGGIREVARGATTTPTWSVRSSEWTHGRSTGPRLNIRAARPIPRNEARGTV